MTGFGEAHHVDDFGTVHVEFRAVNNRHLKLVAKISDPFAAMEPEIERMVRELVRRGTVQLSLKLDRPRREEDFRINTVALQSYYKQVKAAMTPLTASPKWDHVMASLLTLPGIVEARRDNAAEDHREQWPTLAKVVSEALAKFQSSRIEEGKTMGVELLALGQRFAAHLDRVAERGPQIVSSYQTRLEERVQSLVAGRVAIEPKDLIREVAILAERADISEEIVRLRAHLTQYEEVIHEAESSGRKLEFVVQEIGRETNTIGSKANDVEISRNVVEMKGILEKIRELIQNVE